MAHRISNSDLSTLMSRAWAMHRKTSVSMKSCMKHAWELERLQMRLREAGVVNITYRKKDGSIRRALATLNVGSGVFANSAFRGNPSPKVFTYWDIEKCDWRCFNCESLLSWY